jgi:hypothetical protein
VQNLMDYEALRLEFRSRRSGPVVQARGSRTYAVRRRVGGWLVGVGSRMAGDDRGSGRTAADSG